ncbi:MAG TPA: thioesterase family protein [Burkholderiaceae bacterium]|nr:thioesterase family protein [Burkholderiaceae bacterium]
MNPDLKPGLTFEWTYVVPERATVPNLYHDTAFCRDMPNVLATGYMVGMMELACTQGIMRFVDWPREQSVGTRVEFSHLAATPPGMTLTIKGELIEVDGRRVTFRVEAWDGLDKITEGVHERVIISAEKFNARLTEKQGRIPR